MGRSTINDCTVKVLFVESQGERKEVQSYKNGEFTFVMNYFDNLQINTV